MLEALSGYRKVIITLLVFISSVGLLLSKVITADQWVDLNKFVIPSFLAANLIEHLGNKSNA